MTAKPRTRQRLVRLHRWLGLGAAGFWLIQALTGTLIVFHWELDDARVSGRHHATDIAALERRVDSLAPAGSGARVTSIWTSAGAADRYDIYLEAGGPNGARAIRVNGAGEVLRDRADGREFPDLDWLEILIGVHHELLGGEMGRWLVGFSGLLLASNILAGLALGWPSHGVRRRALLPPRSGGPIARYFGWHRAIGLWGAIPALLLVGTGILLAVPGLATRLLPTTASASTVQPPLGTARVSMQAAVDIARRTIPRASLTAITFPTGDAPVWEIRMRAPDEWQRAYGKSSVSVSAVDGRVLSRHHAGSVSFGQRVSEGLFAIHTGEAGGLAGRFAVLLLGVWLLTMILFGLLLWAKRSRAGRR